MALYSEKLAKFMRTGKWEGVMPLPPNFFSVSSYDLKFMSFKFGNDIFVTFEMPRVAYTMIFQKSHFLPIPSICNQRRSLDYLPPSNKLKKYSFSKIVGTFLERFAK
jgi:hypothetical protein